MNGGSRKVDARVLGLPGAPPMRMSPKRGSPCWLPAVPKGWPPSGTWTRLTPATDSQTAAAVTSALETGEPLKQ